MKTKIEVVWSEESIAQTDQIIQYLYSKWSEKEVFEFLEVLKDFEDIVAIFPEIYPESEIKKGFRKAVILKQISVIYSIENEAILVHTLFDNRQDPKFKT